MSSLRVALGYAWARFRARPSQTVVAGGALGVAVASLVLLVLLPSVAGDLLLRRTLTDLAPGDRSVTVVVAPEAQPDASKRAEIDRGLREHLAVRGLGPLRRLLEFRSLAMPDGTIFRLGAVQDLGSMVSLLDGRLPQTCSATMCEVVAVGTSLSMGVKPLPDVIIVGHVSQTDVLPFSGGLSPNIGEVLLIGGDIDAANEMPSLTLIRRIDAWVAAIVPDQVSRPALSEIRAALPRAAAAIEVPGVTVAAPDALLDVALKRADVAGRSLALPISQILVLLFGITALVGLGLRARHQLAADRLARRGAGRRTLAAFDACSSLLVTALGACTGLVLGAAGSLVLLHLLALPVSGTLRAAWSLPVVVGLVLAIGAIGLVTAVFLRLRTVDRPLGRSRVLTTDLVGLVATGVGALLLSRGNSSSDGLSQHADPLLWSLPPLVAITLACVGVRVVPVTTRLLGRLVPRRSFLARVALADATRRPLRPMAAASIIAAAVAFGSFAVAYRASLTRGADEQAAFAVPYDVRLESGPELVQPSQLIPTAKWSDVVSGTMATDVLRRGVTLRRSGTAGDAVDILGLAPATLTSLRTSRSDYGPSPAALGALLAAPAPPLVGTPIPATATALHVDLTGSLAEAEVALVLQRVDGSWHEEKTLLDEQNRPSLTLADGDRGGRFIGFRIGQPSYTTERIEHHVQEGNSFAPAAAVALEIRGVLADIDGASRPLPFVPGAFASRQALLDAGPDGSLRVAVALQGSAALVLPAASGVAQPALVDTLTASAAVDGVVTVDIAGSPFSLRVVATAERFPTLSPRFIVTDQAQLAKNLDLAQPGVGQATEVWLAADSPVNETALAAALAKPPYTALTVDRRVVRQRQLRHDPLSLLTLDVLLASAVLAAILAAGALALNAVAERAEDEPFHRALALEGATERSMNRMVATRAVGLAIAALPVGFLGGASLVAVVVRVVGVAATGATPLPPLRLVVPWAWLTVGLGVLVILLVATGTLASRLTKPLVRHELLRGRP